MRARSLELKETCVDACPPDHLFPGWKIELLAGSKSVSRLWILGKTMRIGTARIRIGGISTVGTDAAYRGRGYAARVMQTALTRMRREGFALSILHGIPGFYQRFDYAPCLPEYTVRLAVADAQRAAPSLRMRRPRSGEWPLLARWYNRENAKRTGSIVRDSKTWRGFPRSVGFFMQAGVRVAVDNRDRILGYVVFDQDSTLCGAAEAGGNDARVPAALLHFLAKRASTHGRGEILLALPPDHAVARFARKLGCEYQIRYPGRGEFMGRILDLPSFLEKALAGFPPPLTKGRLTLQTDLGNCAVESNGMRLQVAAKTASLSRRTVRLAQSSLLQLVLGFRGAVDLAATGDLRGDARSIALLADWFPSQYACMYWPDRF